MTGRLKAGSLARSVLQSQMFANSQTAHGRMAGIVQGPSGRLETWRGGMLASLDCGPEGQQRHGRAKTDGDGVEHQVHQEFAPGHDDHGEDADDGNQVT